MSYKQVKPFSQNSAGKVRGECLRNVRLGYGIGSKYPTATVAWQHTQQHKDRSIPSGVATPLFYSFNNDGHVNVHLSNGQVWSDGNLYSGLSSYESSHPSVHYLGWGESVDDVAVIQYAPDPVPAPSGQRLYFDPIGQTATFYKVSGGTFAMKIKDASYNWSVLKNEGNRVLVNSASAGGDCWVYLKYSNTGNTIPGRYVK